MTGSSRLLLDEMLSDLIAAQLRSRGHDVIAVVEDRMLVGTRDEDVLDYAATQGRCVVTANIRDFAASSSAWVGLGKTHSGIVYVSHHAFPQTRSFIGNLVSALDAAMSTQKIPGPNGTGFLANARRPG